MKKFSKITIVLIITTLVLVSFNFNIVNAAIGSFSANASSTSLTVGGTTTLTIKTTNAEGKFTISSSNSSVVAVSSSSEWVSSSTGITLTAKSAGTAIITVTAENVSDTDLNLITGSKTVTITVKEASNNNGGTTTTTTTTTTKSSDATLKSITVGDTKYTSSLTSISKTVDYNTSSIKVSAVTNNSNASVSGTGTKSLAVGTNTIKLTVTAQDGSTKTYSVKVIRLAEDTTIPNVIENENQGEESTALTLTSLIIADVELSPEFSSDVYNYVTNVTNMTELEIYATASDPEAIINIEGATDLQEGDNIVKITVTLGEENVEYIIDVYNNVIEEILGAVDNNDENNSDSGLLGFIKTIIIQNFKEILLIMMICILAMIAVGYAVLAYRYSKKLKALASLENVEENGYIGEIFQEDQNIKNETSKIGRHF